MVQPTTDQKQSLTSRKRSSCILKFALSRTLAGPYTISEIDEKKMSDTKSIAERRLVPSDLYVADLMTWSISTNKHRLLKEGK